MTALNTPNLDEPADSVGLFTTLLDRFGALGEVELDLPRREEPAASRAAEAAADDEAPESRWPGRVFITACALPAGSAGWPWPCSP